MKQHERVQIVKRAEALLRSQFIIVMKELTTAEYIQLIAKLCSDEITSCTKYMIREERHGDQNKPGDID